MAFNITDITSAINMRGGLAKPSQFFVRITPPSQLVYSDYSREAMFFCDAIQLPGLNYSTVPVRMASYDIPELRPNATNFTSVNSSFIVDADGKALGYFQKWLALINNWSVDTQGVMSGTKLAYGEWNYPEEYEGTVEIHHFEPSGNEIIKYELYKAYPVQVGDINVSWEQNDSIMRLPVVFAYKNWNTENIPPSVMDSEESYRMYTNMLAGKRPDLGLIYSYGLHLLQNGRRSPFSFLGAATTFANLLFN